MISWINGQTYLQTGDVSNRERDIYISRIRRRRRKRRKLEKGYNDELNEIEYGELTAINYSKWERIKQ